MAARRVRIIVVVRRALVPDDDEESEAMFSDRGCGLVWVVDLGGMFCVWREALLLRAVLFVGV